MAPQIILASTSPVRQHMLTAAGVPFIAMPARVDEQTVRDSLLAEGASARDIADTLAEMKARRIAERQPQAVVIGSDQVLEHEGGLLGKAETRQDAEEQLRTLRAKQHKLISAVVVFHQGSPVWRHIGTAKLGMRAFSDSYLEGYLARNWPEVSGCVGCYMVEKEGVRLFNTIEGDHTTVLGLPLLPLLSYLTLRGFIES